MNKNKQIFELIFRLITKRTLLLKLRAELFLRQTNMI